MREEIKLALARRELLKRQSMPLAEHIYEQLEAWAEGKLPREELERALKATPVLRRDLPEEAKRVWPYMDSSEDEALIAFNLALALKDPKASSLLCLLGAFYGC